MVNGDYKVPLWKKWT